MRLHLNEMSRCLNITPTTLERWVRQGRIPVRIKENECSFSYSSLKKWAESNNLSFNLKGSENQVTQEYPLDNLAKAIERGGVFYDVEGASIEEVLRTSVNHITCFQSKGQKEALYDSLIAREQMMSTGIGKGVAIPHPRTPLDYGEIPAFITTCFLRNPVDFRALDRQPVSILFVLVCPSSKSHLHLLARLSFCLRDDDFIQFLINKPEQDAFFQKITEFDNRFDSPT